MESEMTDEICEQRVDERLSLSGEVHHTKLYSSVTPLALAGNVCMVLRIFWLNESYSSDQ
jgi:hypothetical protein